MNDMSLTVALAGQPNCGKSTVFNMLTGARQHVANYPGVTVEKKTGFFTHEGRKVSLVDLPGTYSLTSYSLEERVARDFLLNEKPSLVVNVADASNLKRNLYLTLQLLEMNVPVLLDLNMMDVADRRGVEINHHELSRLLGVVVVPTVGKKNDGRSPMYEGIFTVSSRNGDAPPTCRVDYGPLEEFIDQMVTKLAEVDQLAERFSLRWLALKLLEGDTSAETIVVETVGSLSSEFLAKARTLSVEFSEKEKLTADRQIAFSRHRAAAAICKEVVKEPAEKKRSLSDKADSYVCNKFAGPLILCAILFTLYQISIVWGGDLAAWVWPLWGGVEDFVAAHLPVEGFLQDPLLRSLSIWLVKSLTAILNYLPIFFLLFALISVLEDSGYMPRMAFILDRMFRKFGLHGQSTLPLILGGVYVGGCAIPGVMATKAIPDERARLATILIVPLMNCLAKVPLYLILISAYFADQAGLAMFFIATVTMFMALPISKLLSLTVLRGYESAPFIMEMPPYHLPTLNGILRRAFERIWLFLKKIVTVVAAVALVVFGLIYFPGLPQDRLADYEQQEQVAVAKFMKAVDKTSFSGKLSESDVMGLLNFQKDLKQAKRGVKDKAVAASINEEYEKMNPIYWSVVKRKGKSGKKLNKELKKVAKVRKRIRRESRTERFESSFLGMAGRTIEPVTQYAGFNWRINIALLSAFAAKENAAATIGSIYGIEDGKSVQESMKEGEVGFTPLHALALMLFMALYPPCIPTTVMVKAQTGSTKWMLFSIGYPIVLGLSVATLIYSGGKLLDLTGFEAMWIFYGLCIGATLIMGAIPDRSASNRLP
ncbi:MAG: ferrous iron transport protein B [Halodesulfovibrio sp.]|uniref:ferrous iron transport protein B n=1 Tax=Halodesulfovibrio sp. TaxID=1912772 RepID=UPI00359D90E8